MVNYDRGGYPPGNGGQGGGGYGGGNRNAGYVYRERSVESIRHRMERPPGNFDSIYRQGFDTWKPAGGQNWIRFCPPTWDSWDHYGLQIFVHGFVGPDEGSFLCLHKMQRKPCPVCALEYTLRQRGDEDAARAHRAQERFLYWIIDRNQEPRPRLWNVSAAMDREIVSLCVDIRTGQPLYIDQPDQGFDLIFMRTGQGKKGTRYTGYQIDRQPSPLAQDQRVQDEIMSYIVANPLPSVLQYRPAEYIEQALRGGAAPAAAPDGRAGELLGPGSFAQRPRYEEPAAPLPPPRYDARSDPRYQRPPEPAYDPRMAERAS